jgi:hypothetical protein
MDHALLDFGVTLTTVLPTAHVGVEFAASRTATTVDFIIDPNGRETSIDEAFYLNVNGVSTVPSKGWVLNDGTRDLKVEMVTVSQGDVGMKLDCVARYQRG